MQNFRPISLLPLPGKLLEKLVHNQISAYLESETLLDKNQHGFRKGHSTVHSVAQLVNYISTKSDNGLPTLVAFLDFRKAFDCVQHDVLLRKIEKLNLAPGVVKWVASYLANRKQRVLANNTYSTFLPITQGVPQGSVLGPLFYIIYANDLVSILKNCKMAMYADDTVLFSADTKFSLSVSKVQNDLNAVSTWCHTNGIMVNTDKTKVMVFSSKLGLSKLDSFEIRFDDVPLQIVTSYKYLGITLDSQLTYNSHVRQIISSASNKLKQFQRMRSFLTIRAAILVYKSMLLPILEYGDIFLSAASALNRKKLQTLQNKGLRCALNKGLDCSCADLHTEVGLLKLEHRREQHLLNFMFDWAKDKDNVKKRPSYSIKTRSSKKKLLKLKKPRTEKYKKTFAYVGSKKWNSLPDSFHEPITKHAFKLLVNNRIADRARAIFSGELSVLHGYPTPP